MSEADHLLAGEMPVLCECGHLDLMHLNKTGECGGLDSYGCPCECPSLEEWREEYPECEEEEENW